MSDVLVHTKSFDAPVADLYTAIADSAQHSSFTGAPADLPTDSGSAFTTHGGAIEGWVLELVANERIVQAWRPADWPAGVYSLVRYDFAGEGDGSQITLTHSAIPEGAAEHLAAGWNDRYWAPLADHLAG